jgi:hypothetical protein
MLVTLFGMAILTKLAHEENAQLPMLVTGSPLIMLGIVTAPLEPVYPVMVIAPLLIV